jgi:protein gp37
MGGGFFENLDFYPKRLNDLRKFAPARNAAGELEPKMVFVNSLSDFWHEKIPADFIHRALDAFEQHPRTIMQILTKRPGRMRRFMFERYANRGIPANIWLGVTCEDNRVRRGLDLLRDVKDRIGDFTAFTSIEPITAPCDQIDLTGIDWVLTGGESGSKARPMQFEWLEQANEKALTAAIPLHFKQYDHPRNNPLVQAIVARGRFDRGKISWTRALQISVERGQKLAATEKGGATYKGRVYHEKPKHWHQLKAELNSLQWRTP